MPSRSSTGLAGAAPEGGIAVINLNLRSVVAEPEEGQPSILERLIARMTQQEYWQACEKCDLKGKCYAYHNARTFQDRVAGPKVIERLKTLYTITHLRGRLHITMRDLRSALAFMLVGTQDLRRHSTALIRTAVKKLRTASLTASISTHGLAGRKAPLTV